jgi:hypothetical protein
LLGGSKSKIIGAEAKTSLNKYCQIEIETSSEKARNANSFTPEVTNTVKRARLLGSWAL